MPDRNHLPNRRGSETFSFSINGIDYKATVSAFEDGRIAEIFLSSNKAGSNADTNARDAAVVCSIALQYGTPLEVIREALMLESNGAPSSPLGAALAKLHGDQL